MVFFLIPIVAGIILLGTMAGLGGYMAAGGPDRFIKRNLSYWQKDFDSHKIIRENDEKAYGKNRNPIHGPTSADLIDEFTDAIGKEIGGARVSSNYGSVARPYKGLYYYY